MKTKSYSLFFPLFIFFCLSLVIAFPQPTQAQTKTMGAGGKEVYTGTILYIPSGQTRRTRSTTVTFTLTIEGVTSDADVSRFADILKNDGQDGLLKALSKERKGTMQIGSSIGRDLNEVRITETEEGRKITVLFERWLEFFELRYGTRSRDYPFSYLELYFDEGKKTGGGTMIPAAKIRYKGDSTIEIENFAAFPAKLMGVQRRR